LVRLVLGRIAVGDGVSPAQIAGAFHACADLPSPTRDVILGSLLTAVVLRGPAADEVEALLRTALDLDQRDAPETVSDAARPVLLLAGSGKKGRRTLNVSTPAALVAAALGANVIKIGSAATSSAVGSRDLARALGLRERRTAPDVRADLRASGFSFVAVEPEIPLLDRLYGGRLHAPNPFSFGLAPLASPVRGDISIFGLSHPRVGIAAEVLHRFGMDEVDVLSTRMPDGSYLDEIGLAGELYCCRVRNGTVGTTQVDGLVGNGRLYAADLPAPREADEAIDLTAELLAGGGVDSHRALVAVNCAYLLMRSGRVASLGEGRRLAEDALRSGTALSMISRSAADGRS